MNEDQMRAEFEDWWKQELLIKHKRDIDEINTYFKRTLQGDYIHAATAMRWEGWQAAIASQAKNVPIGYIDREQLTRWEKLRGTEFEQDERALIGFSTKPFKTEMTDCTLAVYAAPQPADDRVLELEKDAARYRFWRGYAANENAEFEIFDYSRESYDEMAIDAAIDQAMNEANK